jgi:hypothetical protein
VNESLSIKLEYRRAATSCNAGPTTGKADASGVSWSIKDDWKQPKKLCKMSECVREWPERRTQANSPRRSRDHVHNLSCEVYLMSNSQLTGNCISPKQKRYPVTMHVHHFTTNLTPSTSIVCNRNNPTHHFIPYKTLPHTKVLLGWTSNHSHRFTPTLHVGNSMFATTCRCDITDLIGYKSRTMAVPTQKELMFG